MIGETVRTLLTGTGLTNPFESSDDDESARSRSGPQSSLFSCPECDVVYIAIDKETCSSCRGDVREVSPTLTNGEATSTSTSTSSSTSPSPTVPRT